MNDPLTGHFNSNLSVPIQQTNRIEIIRGPASASYGSDAMEGVIAVSTNTYVNYIQIRAASSSVDTIVNSKRTSYKLLIQLKG